MKICTTGSLVIILVTCLLVPFQHGYAQHPVNNASKPNIIYIYADDMGYAVPGCYGQQLIPTPNLDKLANDGMKFTQHYASAPVCSPSRTMLLTGVHAGHSYIRGNYELGGFADSLEGGQMPLPPGIATMPGMLRKAGYTTALCGKWGLGMHTTSGSPLKHGFDYYYGYLDQKQAHNYYPTHLWENDKKDTLDNDPLYVHQPLDPKTATDKDFDKFTGRVYSPGRITEKALGFVKQNKNKPFFLYLAYSIPHVSLQAPREYVDKFKDRFDDKPYYGQQGYASTKYPRATYAAMISYLDDQVGKLLQTIKELGIEKNTIIMFSSDNGASTEGGADVYYFNSTGNLRGLKRELYEGGIKVPFIVKWPGKVKPRTTSELVSSQYDLMATLAEINNVPAGETDGISFLPELLGKKAQQKQHEYLYFEFPGNDGQVAIRMGKWKFIKTGMMKDHGVTWQLYNLEKDPSEKNDVAGSHPDLIKRADEMVKKEHQCAHIREWEFIDPKYN